MDKHNLTGRRFGRLVVIEEIPSSSKHNRWRYVCDCGAERDASTSNLMAGKVKSCGCLRREITSARRLIHGQSVNRTRTYRIWAGMHYRCKRLPSYAGRGIYVCPEWKDFATFGAWSKRSGYADSLSIDRIDNDGPYAPDNCRWADRKTQSRNRRSSALLTFDGETKTIAEWAEITGLESGVIRDRVARGWPTDKALKTPLLT